MNPEQNYGLTFETYKFVYGTASPFVSAFLAPESVKDTLSDLTSTLQTQTRDPGAQILFSQRLNNNLVEFARKLQSSSSVSPVVTTARASFVAQQLPLYMAEYYEQTQLDRWCLFGPPSPVDLPHYASERSHNELQLPPPIGR